MVKAATTTEQREHFEALVREAERLIEESPGAYRARLAALALLGYAVIFGILLVLVALLGGTIWAAFASTVIAHEGGHLSGNHSRFSGWIYRVRLSWYRIMETFDEAEGFGVAILRRFFDWYAPYFNALSFALARANEYEADAVAVELTSSDATASALVGSVVRNDVSAQEYWQPLLRRAEIEPEPERAPYRGLARFHAEHTVDVAKLDEYLERALARTTDHSDTHPALRDRLAAIGVEPKPRFNVARSAAEAWLGDALDGLLDTLDAAWIANCEDGWRRRYEETIEGLAVLEALEARSRDQLEPLELWQLAALTERHRDAATALALFREYAAREPEDRDADFVIGRLLLDRDDAAGIACMERAAERFGHALAACEYVYIFYLRNDDEAAAKLWRLRSERQVDLENRARAERASLDKKDVLIPSELSDEWLANLRDQLASRKDVRHAWVARKRIAIAPENPLYVIAFQSRGLFTSDAKVAGRLVEEIEVPGECFFIARAGETKLVAKQVADRGMQLF